MSQQSKKKQLHNQLENLFVDLEQETQLEALDSEPEVRGWTWECDKNDNYTACSPEVQAILGFSHEEFLDKNLLTFAVTPDSRNAIQKALDSGIFPAEINAKFFTAHNTILEVTLHIFENIAANGEHKGWHGFTQVLMVEEIPAPTPVVTPNVPAPEPAAPQEIDINSLTSGVVAEGDYTFPAHTPLTATGHHSLQNKENVIIDKDENEPAVLAKPFRMQEKTLGLLEIVDDNPNRVWTEDERILVEEVVDQLSLALENANLFQQTQVALSETDELARRLTILNEMSEQLSQTADFDAICQITIDKTYQIFPMERVSLTMVTADKEHVEVRAIRGEEGTLEMGTLLPLAGTANHVAIQENRIVINPDTEDPNLGAIRSFMVGPINAGGEIIGTLNVGSRQSDVFTPRDEDFMQQLLSLLGAVLENHRLFDAIQAALSGSEEQSRRLALLNDMSEQFSQTNDLDEIIKIAVFTTYQILKPDRSCAGLVSPDIKTITVRAAIGLEEELPVGATNPIHPEIMTAFQENRIVNVKNIYEESLPEIQSTLIAPLTSGGRPLGALITASKQWGAFSEQDNDILLQVSSLLSSTIENINLFQQIHRRSAQLETSSVVSRSASSILDTSELFQEVVDLIHSGFNLYYVGLFLVDQTGDWTGEPNRWAMLQAGTGEAGKQMIAAGHKLELGGESMIGSAIANADARIALDVGEEAVFFRNPYLPNTRSEMALPLISRGEVLGALSIQSELESAFTNEDITALQTMADQVANAIENARLIEQTQDRAEELAILNEMARAFTQTLDVDKVVEHVFHYTSRLMDASNFYLALYDQKKDEIEFRLYMHNGEFVKLEEPRRKAGNGLTEWVIRNPEPLLIAEDVENWVDEMGIDAIGTNAESWLGVPMLRGRDVIGVITVQSYTTPRIYNAHHLDLLSAVSNQAATAIENARLFQQASSRARREQILREITAQVHSSADADTILRTAVREVSNALGRQAYIYLGNQEETKNNAPTEVEVEEQQNNTDGSTIE
jgi:GAF domain-containing protein